MLACRQAGRQAGRQKCKCRSADFLSRSSRQKCRIQKCRSAESGLPEVQVQKCRLFSQPGTAEVQIPESASAEFGVQKAEILWFPPPDYGMMNHGVHLISTMVNLHGASKGCGIAYIQGFSSDESENTCPQNSWCTNCRLQVPQHLLCSSWCFCLNSMWVVFPVAT